MSYYSHKCAWKGCDLAKIPQRPLKKSLSVWFIQNRRVLGKGKGWEKVEFCGKHTLQLLILSSKEVVG